MAIKTLSKAKLLTLKIPKSFKLHGRTITIEFDSNMVAREDNLGMANYRSDKIILQPTTDGRTIPPLQIEENFWHELVHWLFHCAGVQEQNEQIVDVMGGLLHQAITSMEYDDTDR